MSTPRQILAAIFDMDGTIYLGGIPFDFAVRFIDNLRAEYPSCHVVLKSIQGPCQDGFGISYGCMWNYREKHEFVLNMYELYAEIASEYENACTLLEYYKRTRGC